MMAVINLSSVFEYGQLSSILCKVGCIRSKEVNGLQAATAMCMMVKKAAAGVLGLTHLGGVDKERMDINDKHRGDAVMRSFTSEDALPKQPPAFKFAFQLTFSMLSYVLQQPTCKSSQYSYSNLNPYLTVLLTFLSIILKHCPPLDILKCSIPWEELGAFLVTVPRKIMISQGLMSEPGKSNSHWNVEWWVMLTSSCAPPLVKDWCLHGMEWVGHKVYEHGFWKSSEEHKVELKVLEPAEGGQLMDGMIKDNDSKEHMQKSSSTGDLIRRWVCILLNVPSIFLARSMA